jgi:hypothetical protein
MNFTSRIFLLGCVAGTMCFANTITILNPGFELPVYAPGGYVNDVATNWNVTGDAGTWNPQPAPGTFFSAPVPEGSQVLAVGFQHASDVNQNLSVGLTANTTYTLTYFVGRRLDVPMSAYTVSLDAGATVLASDSGATPAAGTFVSRTITFTTGASPVAGNIIIDISAAGLNQTQTAFDLFSLTTASAVPEPATLSFLGIGLAAMAFARRRSRKA